MKKFSIDDVYKAPVAIALGFFDCLHLGHAAIINKTVEYAAKVGVQSAVFTFDGDLSKAVAKSKQLYTFEERCAAFSALGAQVVCSAKPTERLLNAPAEQFFQTLCRQLNIKAVFVGEDFTFGKSGAGDVALLQKLCTESGIQLRVVPFVMRDGDKISTSALKRYVENGDMPTLNSFLPFPYFMLGTVRAERHVGRMLGFPTANILPADDRVKPADGIYATRLEVDGKCYDAMTNVGGKPTFGVEEASIESYIFDFDGDLYAKTIKLSFFERTRDVIRFNSPDELRRQLERDEEQVRQILKKYPNMKQIRSNAGEI